MAQLTTRTTSAPGATAKGSPLTNAEVDQNFNRLNKAGPQIRPSLLLDFANSESVDNRITFNRASAATRYDSNGVLQTLRNDKPRIDFDPVTGECKGLLIEEQRTNISGNVSYPSSVSFLNCFGVFNAAVAPDGTYTALLVQNVPSPTSVTCLFVNALSTVSAGQVYRCSIYVKAGPNPDSIAWAIYDVATSVNYGSINIAWTNGVPSITGGNGTGAISSAGNGWYRVSVTATVAAGKTNMLGLLYPSGGGAGSKNIYCWGSQFELGSFDTSLIDVKPIFTSRNSSATYFDSTGVLRTAGPNQARYGYGYDSDSGKWVSQGLLLEGAATNLILSSITANIGSNWQQYNTAVLTENYSTAPDGSMTAGRITTTSAGTVRVGSGALSSSTSYCASIWVKSNTGSNYTLALQVGDTNVAQITATPTWQRFSGAGSPQQTGYNFIDLEQIQAGADISVWGAQLETSAVATSYIPTFGSTATRAADVSSSAAATRAADNLAMDFSRLAKTKGFTVAGEAEAFGGQSGRIIALAPTSSDTSNIFSVNFEPANFRTYQYSGGALRFNTAGAGYLANTFLKFALGVSGSAFSTVVNGYRESGTGAVEMQTDHLRIGSMNPGQYYLSGHIKRLAYFPQKLSDNELTAFTQ
jgi:hypothetical protein